MKPVASPLLMTLNRKRWLVIVAGIIGNACCGAGYAFSVFKKPLIAVLHCTDPQATLAFSLSVVFLPVGMLLSGAIAKRRGPRIVIAVGGVIFGMGMFLAGFSGSLGWLYVTFGLMVSLGQGMSYGTIIATAVRWFPDRKGLASGLVVSALGIGTLIVAPVARELITSVGVLDTLRILGAAIVIVIGTASLFITDPPKGYAPVVAQGPLAEQTNEVGWQKMLFRPLFWMLFVLYVLGAFTGLMIISHASDIAQKMTGLTATAASFVVGMLGAANSAGRLFWGGISDRIGRFTALAAMCGITAVVMLLLPGLALYKAGLIVAYLLIGLCYGGCLGTFPSLCADSFGSKDMAVNYALLFVAFGVAGVMGPRVGAVLLERTGAYTTAFALTAAIAAAGMILSLSLKLRRA